LIAAITIASTSFWEALTGDLPFIRNALIAGLIASASFGVVGSYVVARRISYIAASIAHSVLGGIGAALYLQRAHGIDWLHPIVGALIAALLSALAIGLVTLYAEEREDTIIGAIWATGMAVGLLFLHFTPPPAVDAMSYFFGEILIISRSELIAVGALGIVVMAIGLFYYNKFVAVCFDEEFALLRGVNVSGYYILLLGLTAVSVVLLVTLVGIILAIALLTIPAAIASRFAGRLWQMMLISVILSGSFISGGLALSYQVETPTGPTIIIIAAAAYFISLLGGKYIRRGA
jgi:zinc transport system permease protein